MKLTNLSSRIHKHPAILIFYVLCLTLSASLILFSCSDNSTGSDTDSNGNGNGNGNNNGGTTIGTSPTFDNVSQIFTSACGDCHTSFQESGVRLNNYNNVINSVGDQYGTNVVNPGSAETSPLIDKIASSNPSFGVRMPEGGPFLSNDRINQIRTWINNGANDDESDDADNDNSNGSDY
jgi:hypothetical protein